MKNKEFYRRAFCFFMIINLLTEVFFPTAALALTSGPDQPETQSFEPVGTTQMVDLFTGDFNYNIPLLTVPGPNGGYPVNLAYHAGITPDQEASWVGLGWNVNAGSINRNMRGLPDEFFGQDIVTKQMSMKPNWIFGLDAKFPAKSEILGFSLDENLNIFQNSAQLNFSGLGLQGIGVYYNNYKGLGIRFKMKSLAELKLSCVHYKEHDYNLGVGLTNFNFDSQEGVTLKPDYSFQNLNKEAEKKKKETIKDKISAKIATKFPKYGKEAKEWKTALGGYKSPYAFANPSYVPNTSFPEGGFDASLWVKFGTTPGLGIFANATLKGFLFFQDIKDKTINYPSYGYLHLGERNRVKDELPVHENYTGVTASKVSQSNKDMALMDFNRENDGTINMNSPNLKVPSLTYDVFNVSGQGIGMVFRPHRTDVGLVYDPRTSSEFVDVELGFDLGVGNGGHIGVNPGVTYTSSYRGRWKGQYKDFEKEFEYTNSIMNVNDVNGDDNVNVFQEPFYFKSSDDMSVSGESDGKFKYDDIFSFEIASVGDFMDPSSLIPTVASGDFDPANYTLQVFPKIKNQTAGPSTTKAIQFNKNLQPTQRSNSIEYKTRHDITYTTPANTSALEKHIFGLNQFPYLNTSPPSNQINYTLTSDKKGHHIAQFSAVNPDGNVYVYALPVYNMLQKEVAFSTAYSGSTVKSRHITYAASEATLDNAAGSDNFFSSNQMPAYPSSYLLTEVHSADYVDVTGNGPSDDDLGHYVKFNYSPLTQESVVNPTAGYYKWRIPFSGAIHMENYAQHEGDNKGVYIYGEKEVYYLNSIETKTHFAIFELNDNLTDPRQDGYGASTEADNSHLTPNPNLALPPRCLKKIKLYSKQNTTTPLKTVHFEYDYSLCPNTPNSIASNKGKLTLTKVFFTYMDNDGGSLSPYEFTYNSFNPSYNPLLNDVWGNYKEDKSINISRNYYNEDFPFVDQDKATADAYAAAWSLTKIKMPSGGVINVEYESDDYQFVQDKTAMQMLEIVDTGYDDNLNYFYSANWNVNQQPSLTGELHDLVVFKLKRPTASQAELNKYITGMKHMYFKANMKLKQIPNTNQMAYDYVSGFAEIDPTYTVRGLQPNINGEFTLGVVKVKYVSGAKVDVFDHGKLHPFRKATFEYMKLRRPELFFPVNGSTGVATMGVQALYTIVSLLQGLGQQLAGYNSYCKMMGFGKEIASGLNPGIYDDDRSYIRLNVPDGHKYGGGHRVSKLYVEDKWNTNNPNEINVHGQEFIYMNSDKTSSGVAEYEPSSGSGAENPLKKPNDAHMNERTFIADLEELYQKTPICESYFPAANVGYSRVITKSLDRGGVNSLSADGSTVYEFYTAKDCPVQEKVTTADKTTFKKAITIPLIGKISLSSNGFSQGYRIILNDMHGKPKAVRTYPSNVDLLTSLIPSAINEVEYTYNYDGTKKELKSSMVPTLYKDGTMYTREIGIDRDFVMDMDQSSNFTVDAGLLTNLDFALAPPFISGNLLLNLNYSHNTGRTFVNVKSIYKQAILLKTVVRNDKAVTTTQNLMFDQASGRPLLTVVNNEFNQPVYNYDIPGHWYFDNMGSRAPYYRFASTFTLSGSSINVQHATYFNVGDRVRLSATQNMSSLQYKDYWVSSKTLSNLVLINETGATFSGPSTYSVITLVDPIKKNELNTDAGLLVSLTDPVNTPNFHFLVSLNGALGSFGDPPPTFFQLSSGNCATGFKETINCSFSNSLPGFVFSTLNCKFEMILPPFITAANFHQYEYYRYGNSNVIKIKDLSTNMFISSTGLWSDPSGCMPNCLDGVLHAESYVFADQWTYDYVDLGDPLAYGTTSLSGAVSANPYKYGTRGINRFKEKYLYQVERKQSAPHTDIAKDGTYRVFNWYNWSAPGNLGSNKEWTLNNTATKYSHYGFEAENKDINNMYSSSLFGYNNSVSIASGFNVPYDQLSFQHFEEVVTSPTLFNVKGGHLNLKYLTAVPIMISNTESHTGKQSLIMTGEKLVLGDLFSQVANTTGGIYHIEPGKKYVLSFWMKTPSSNLIPNINAPTGGGGTVSGIDVTPDKIDGWRRVEAIVTINIAHTSATNMIIDPSFIPGAVYFDDIRLQPLNSTVKAHVYDRQTLWTVADLDERNYATFYNYDESGNLVQVKKETAKGVVTVLNHRKSIKRTP